MKQILAPLFILSCLAGTSLADGASNAISIAKKADDCTLARQQGKPCFLDMEEESVDGGVPTASGERIDALTLARGRSLIKLRLHFMDQILKSPELL